MNGNEFGKLLLEYRKKNNLTQLELGEKLNVSDKTISRWERGDRVPDSFVIKDISKLLNVSIDQLLNSNNMNEINDSKDKENKNIKKKLFSLKKNKINNFPIYFLIICLVLIICLLSFCLYNNYNQFVFYALSSRNKEINVNGQLIVSPEKKVLIINEITNVSNSELNDLNLYDYQYEILIDNKEVYQYGNISGYVYDEYSELMTMDDVLKEIKVYIDNIKKFKNNYDISLKLSYLDEERISRSVIITLNINRITSNNKIYYK
mgnify:CR=1 FL=1